MNIQNRLLGLLKPSKKKAIFTIILLTLLGFGLTQSNNKPQPLQFTQVKKQDIKSTVSSSGTLTGKDNLSLKFKSSGKLFFLNVKVGDSVYAGQVIAGLDTQDLAIKLQQAQNTLRDKEALAQKAEDDVKDHASDESFAQKVTRTTAQVARDSAYDSVKEAQRAFQDAVIVSPISGIITSASPIPGQIVSSSDTIAQVVDFSLFYFDTDIDEADISKISLGQKAEIILDAYPDKTLSGTVAQIIPQTKTTSSGATVITVRINLGNLNINPVNGLSGQAIIVSNEVKNALTLPQEALRDDNSIVIQTAQGLQAKKVTTGIKSDIDVQITEGVTENERVVLNPPASITSQNRSQNPLNGVLRFIRGGNGGGGARFNGAGRGQ